MYEICLRTTLKVFLYYFQAINGFNKWGIHVGHHDQHTYMLFILVPLIFINWIRNLKFLAPLSMVANIITFISFGFIVYFIFEKPISFQGKEWHAEASKFPLFLGTVLFSLESIGVVSSIFF